MVSARIGPICNPTQLLTCIAPYVFMVYQYVFYFHLGVYMKITQNYAFMAEYLTLYKLAVGMQRIHLIQSQGVTNNPLSTFKPF